MIMYFGVWCQPVSQYLVYKPANSEWPSKMQCDVLT